MTATLDAAAPFDMDGWLAGLDPDLLAVAEGRRVLTECDPLLFAAVYLPHHITMDGQLSLSEFHLDLVEQAKRWMVPAGQMGGSRDAYVAPRESGKSTWLFLILLMWAAAHGHIRFVAAFADSAPQAEEHLATFKHELDTNARLREDFPDLCSPGRRPAGVNMGDRRALYIARSGFVFSARGIDTSVLGLKVGSLRPDLIVLDDIEKDEARYSEEGARKRLGTIMDAILPLSVTARTVLTGTVTMPNSIMHQLVKAVRTDDVAPWITENRFITHYYPPIITDPDGSERSLWPAKWPLPFLLSIRHTRTYAKNYANDPMGADGEFWRQEDFTHTDIGVSTHQLLSIDPAVTTKKTSDFTGLAVVSWSPAQRCHSVDDAFHVKIPPGPKFRARVLQVLADFPLIRRIVVETNQGGDTWRAILHDMGVPVETVHQCEAKTERATVLLNHYQARPKTHVVHRRPFPDLEAEMVTYPRGLNDDILDAVGTGIEYNQERLEAQLRPPRGQAVRSESWV